MKLPLEDGDEFVDQRGRRQVVAGSIRKNPGVHVVPDSEKEYDHTVCWTRRGNWFRRSDGVEVTGLFRDENGSPVPLEEARHRVEYKRYD